MKKNFFVFLVLVLVSCGQPITSQVEFESESESVIRVIISTEYIRPQTRAINLEEYDNILYLYENQDINDVHSEFFNIVYGEDDKPLYVDLLKGFETKTSGDIINLTPVIAKLKVEINPNPNPKPNPLDPIARSIYSSNREQFKLYDELLEDITSRIKGEYVVEGYDYWRNIIDNKNGGLGNGTT